MKFFTNYHNEDLNQIYLCFIINSFIIANHITHLSFLIESYQFLFNQLIIYFKTQVNLLFHFNLFI